MNLQYREYQKEAAKFIAKHKKAYLCLEQGLGKTATAIAAATPYPPILIVCPSIATTVWEEELEKWLRVTFKVQRIAKGADEIKKDSEVVIISFGLVSKKVKELITFGFKTMIIDEAHFCKTPTAQRTKAVMLLARVMKRIYALTGTPMPNRPIELWPMMSALKITDLNYHWFGRQFCGAWKPPWRKGQWDFSGSSNEEELKELLNSKMFRLTKEEADIQLPDKTYQVISLNMPVDKRERNFSLEDIAKQKSTAGFTGLSEILHMQGMSKVPKVVTYVKELFESGSVKKMIIFCHHSDVAEEYVTRLKKDFGAVKIVGATSTNKRKQYIEDFQTDEKTRVIVLNIKAACTAITLTAANMVMFAENSWVAGEIEQASDRAHRIGQKNNVLVQFLTIEKSIDDYMVRRILEKMETINKIV